MAILAEIPHNGKMISVEVTDAFTSSRGKVATVKATTGAAIFPEWTHGGWSYSTSTTIPAGLLRNIRHHDDNALILAEAEA